MNGGLIARFEAARGDPALAVLEGFHALKHALRFGAAIEVAAALDGAKLEALAGALAPDLAGRFGRLVRTVDAATFARLAPRPPETGVIALARRPAVDAEAVLMAAEGRIVLLDRPAHPGNLGAVVRVAAAARAAGVVAMGPLDPWHPAALRGAAGLHFALPVARLERLPAVAGRPLVAVDPAGTPLRPGSLARDAILVFGSERRGLAPALRGRADAVVALPMRQGVSSLNLATAVAATLYAAG